MPSKLTDLITQAQKERIATDGAHEITDKQRVWAEAYVGQAKFDVGAACELVGVAHSNGYSWKNNPLVRQYMDILRQDWVASSKATAARVVRELESIAFSNIVDVIGVDGDGSPFIRDLDSLSLDAQRSIKKIKTTTVPSEGGKPPREVIEIEFHDKNRALTTLVGILHLADKDKGGGAGRPMFTGFSIKPPVGESVDVEFEDVEEDELLKQVLSS